MMTKKRSKGDVHIVPCTIVHNITDDLIYDIITPMFIFLPLDDIINQTTTAHIDHTIKGDVRDVIDDSFGILDDDVMVNGHITGEEKVKR